MESSSNSLGKGLEAATYLIQVLYTEVRDSQQSLLNLNNQICRLEGNLASMTRLIDDGEQSMLIKVTSLKEDVDDLENVLNGVALGLERVKTKVEEMEIQRNTSIVWLSRLAAICSFIIPLLLTLYIFFSDRKTQPPQPNPTVVTPTGP
jgi:hypothetical protein